MLAALHGLSYYCYFYSCFDPWHSFRFFLGRKAWKDEDAEMVPDGHITWGVLNTSRRGRLVLLDMFGYLRVHNPSLTSPANSVFI